MGAQEVDRLEVAVKANAQSANQQLDTLINRLTAVNSALRNVNSGGLQGLSNSVKNFSSSMQSMKSVGTADFTRLTKNIQKLTSIDNAALNRTASSMNVVGKSLNNLSAVSTNAIQIGEVAKNIAKFGSVSVTRAIDNMPKLSKALSEMMASLSKAPSVSQNLIQMTNALANLTANGSKVGSSVSSMNRFLNNTGNATNRAGLGLHLFSTRANGAMKSSKGLASSIGMLYAKFWMLLRALKGLGKSANSAMDFIETAHYFNTVADKIGTEFGNQFEKYGYDSAETYANSFNARMQTLTGKMTGYTFDQGGNANATGTKSLNLDVRQMTDYQAGVMAVTNSLGLCGEVSVNTAKAFSMLSADMSSLRNVDLQTVMTNLTSGLIGQSRALYKYGIDITNNTLQQYAYANGISKSVSAMTQSEKMQLRLLAILDQSKVAWGDMANTLNTPANQLRVLKQNFANLARVIGNLFMPIVAKVLPYINALVMALQRLFTWVARIFGIDLSGLSSSVGTMDDAYADLVDDTNDYTDAVDKANKATKALKTTTLGIDELNINNPSDDSGSGSSGSGAGGSGIDLSDQIASALADYDKVWNQAFENMENKANDMADKICDAFKKHDYTGIGTYISDGISDALEAIPWDSVYSVASNFGKGFAQFLNGLITPRLFGDVGKTIAGALNTAIYTALSFGETFDWTNLGDSIATGINDFLETFDFKALGKGVNAWVQGIKKTFITTIKKVKWSDVMDGIADFLSELDISTVAILIGAFALKHGGVALTAKAFSDIVAKKLGVSGGQMIMYLGIGVGVFFGTIYLLEHAKGWIDAIKEKIGNLIVQKTKSASLENGEVTVEVPLKAKLQLLQFNIQNAIKNFDLADSIKKIFTTAPIQIDWSDVVSFQWTKQWFTSAKEAFKTAFDGNRSDIVDIGSYILEGILDGFVGAFSFITEPITRFFKEVWNSICKAFGIHSPAKEMEPLGKYIMLGIVEGFTAEIKSFKNAVSDFFNNDVKPLFTKEKWKQSIGSIKEAISERWGSALAYWETKLDLSEIKTTYENFAAKVGVKWDELITYWNNKKPLSEIKASCESIKEKVKKKWDELITWWDNNRPDLSEITAKIKLPHLSVSWDTDGAAAAALQKLGLKGFPNFSVSYYKNGGFPDVGDLFFANENGVPELVGTMNGKPAVGSGMEITGISDAVYNTSQQEVALLREQNALLRELVGKDFGTHIGDKEIARANIRGQRELGMRLRTT